MCLYGLEGIDLIVKEQDQYDVIILDLIMPNKDGMYVLEEMQKRRIDKKVIVATSYNSSDVIRQVSDYGVNYFILKPFELSDLEKRIVECQNRSQVKKNIDFHHNNLQCYQFVMEHIMVVVLNLHLVLLFLMEHSKFMKFHE